MKRQIKGTATQLQRKLIAARGRLRGDRFLKIVLDSVNTCNLRCRMCFFGAFPQLPKREVWTLEQYSKLAREAFPRTQTLTLSCATEPLLNPKIAEFVQIAKDHGVPQISMVTNGQMLNEARIEALVRGGLTTLMVSMDGAKPETYEAIRVGGNYKRLVENLRTLAKVKERLGSSTPNVTFNYVLMRSNLDEVEEFIDLAVDLGGVAVDFRHIVPYDEADIADEMLDETMWTSERVEATRAACERAGLHIVRLPVKPDDYVDTVDECGLPFEMAVIRHTGDVTPCGHWTDETMGNIFEDGFWSVWRGKRYRYVRSHVNSTCPPDACRECLLRSFTQLESGRSISLLTTAKVNRGEK
ncbi:radical SAM protein [bacterium]|nr:radical SAM protein [bacterium]